MSIDYYSVFQKNGVYYLELGSHNLLCQVARIRKDTGEIYKKTPLDKFVSTGVKVSLDNLTEGESLPEDVSSLLERILHNPEVRRRLYPHYHNGTIFMKEIRR